MKLIIASDIHGSAVWCKKLAEVFKREKADRLLLLGDILYHGPRNPLPDGYSPKEVVELLSELKEKILCVRGNCDSEVDQMVLPFPVTADYAAVFADGINIYLSHGHRETPPLLPCDVFATGHTHVPVCERLPYLHINPGSVALPKEDSPHSYIIYENREFSFRDFDGKEFKNCKI